MALMTERPMSDTEPYDFEALLETLEGLDVPGYQAEVIRGSIVLSPWSRGYYRRVMKLVCTQLEPHLPEGHVLERAPYLFVFPGDSSAYGPDVFAAHEDVFETEAVHLDGAALSFVAELTSPSTRNNDLTDKVEVYARAGVAVYLILDMQAREAIVYGSPSAKGYQIRINKPFGEEIPVPAPFDCVLDTAEFHRPDGRHT